MHIINRLKRSQVIPIVLADGKFDTISLHSKVELPKGANIRPDKVAEFANTITVVGQKKGQSSEMASS
jgi:hypothetical protein